MNESVQYRFTAYLMKSIKNERTRYCEKQEERTSLEVVFEEERLDLAGYEQDFIHSSSDTDFMFENEQLAEIVSRLKEKDQTILRWKFVFRLKHNEMAARLGISKEAMDKRYQRLINKIREEMMK